MANPAVKQARKLVASCVEYVQLAADLGDQEMVAMRDTAGNDAAALEAECTDIVLSDPERARTYQAALAELKTPATSTTTATPQTDAPTTPAPTQPPAPPVVAQALMPDVLCMDLQSAQNAIQRAGVFYSQSFDATGAGRMQLIDSNWLVVSQDPAPGTPIGEGDAMLGVVKFGEGTC